MDGVETLPLELLRDFSPAKRLAAATSIKHSIVGSPRSKKIYLSRGAPRLFTSLLADPATLPALSVECAAVLTAFARVSEDVAREIVAGGALQPLEKMLKAEGEVRSNAARALGVLRQWGGVNLSDLRDEDAIVSIIRLLECEEFASVALGFLIPACKNKGTIEMLVGLKLPDILINLLGSAKSRRTIRAVLQLLATICEASTAASRCVVEGGVVGLARKTIRVGNVVEKMAGVNLLSALHCQGVVGSEVIDGLLITLFDLLSENDESIDDDGAKVLARLLRVDESFQHMAVDCCAGFDIVVLLERCVGDAKKNIIYAMAKLASDAEDLRASMSGLIVMKHLLDALSNGDKEMVMTASLCMQYLTRSPKFLRDKREVKPMLNQILDEILEKLLCLCSSLNIEVQRSAIRAVCNMVLASPRKLKTTSRETAWRTIVGLTSSTDEDVRLHAIWSLKNLFFEIRMEDLASVQKLFEQCNLMALCQDSSYRVREQTISVIRNLSCGMTDVRHSQSIEHLKMGLGENLFRILDQALESTEDPNHGIALQALHVIGNVAASDERHKLMLLKRGLVKKVVSYLTHGEARLRIAAIRVVTNLASPDCGRGVRKNQAHEADVRRVRRRFHMSGRMTRSGLPESNGSDFLCENKPLNDAGVRPEGSADDVCTSDSRDREEKYMHGQRNSTKFSDEHVTRVDCLVDLGAGQQLRSLHADSHVEVRFRSNEALELLRRKSGTA